MKRLTTQINQDKAIESLKQSGGDIQSACKHAIIGRTQFYHWINHDDEFKERVVDVYTRLIRFVKKSKVEEMVSKHPDKLDQLLAIFNKKLNRITTN